MRLASTLRRTLCSQAGKGRNGGEKGGRGPIYTREDVKEKAAEKRKHEEAVRGAEWVSSWMMPWERAQMDYPTKPLAYWERVYWRLFVVLGGVGFAYETWVLGNRRLWISKDKEKDIHNDRIKGPQEGLYEGAAFGSNRLLSDEELEGKSQSHFEI